MPAIVLLHPHGGMGDLILSFPVIQAFADAFPEDKIFYVPPPGMDEVVKAHPSVAAVLPLSDLPRIKGIRIGCALWSTARVAWILRRTGIPVRIGQAGRLFSSFLFTHRVQVRSARGDEESHWVECLLDYPRAIGLNPQNKGISIVPTQAGNESAMRLLAGLGIREGDRVAVIHAGKGENVLRRGWPVDLFAKVGDRLSDEGYRVLFTGGKGEVELVDSILKEMNSTGASLAGRTDFRTLTSLLKFAGVMICPDSGPMHLAAAVGTPVVALFAMEKDFPNRWAPWQVEHVIIRPESFPCRSSCSKETCSDFLCYRQLSDRQIAEAALSLAVKPRGQTAVERG